MASSRRRHRRAIILGAAIVAISVLAGRRVVVSGPGAGAPPSSGTSVALPAVASRPRVFPAALPRHLGIGLSAPPSSGGLNGWMPDSGIPFDYAYQYLAGGVNTGTGWTTWNDRAQFPLFYAKSAATHRYVPVFTYYMLLQSHGTCGGCNEAAKDLANLDDRATMTAYYADFTKLMQRLGSGTWDDLKGFGSTVIVHIEPDLSGYAEQAVTHHNLCYGHCHGPGNDPSKLRAAVAGTGVVDVAAYPDTYQGFNFALLHLRDLYAPNVLLAFHVSNWATGKDIGSSRNSRLDAAALGAEVGTFASAAGVATSPAATSTYDLVFNDVADRDAAVSRVWWDRTNRTAPNFTRWERFMDAVTRTTGKSAIAWQVPLGNQWFRTEDGSVGHTQDNRIEYFFAHPAELVDVGIVGVLYGRGNATSTTNTDDRHDAVTNPPPRCTRVGGGLKCNDHPSTSSDDDGGYLRMEASLYYRNPVALPSTGGR